MADVEQERSALQNRYAWKLAKLYPTSMALEGVATINFYEQQGDQTEGLGDAVRDRLKEAKRELARSSRAHAELSAERDARERFLQDAVTRAASARRVYLHSAQSWYR
jgi:hypothetical protein